MSKTIRLASISLLFILLLTLAYTAGVGVSQEKSPAEGIDLVKEAWEVIFEDFVDSQSLSAEELAEGAIRGLVEALDDPYTAYLDAEQYEMSRTQLTGKFSGIGATITIKDGELTVIAPIAGSPAEQAGVRPGDKILEVDGEPTSEMGLHEATLKIRGEEGTKVRLLVLHPNEDTPVEIEIMRAEIELSSVELEMLPDNIALIKLTNFSDRTDSELTSALKGIMSQGTTGIVLDLRYNPGGVVNAAVNVVNQFIEEGIVLYALDNKGRRTEWSVRHRGLALDIPLAVLVNGHSASASEVVAGALQDYNRGPIIGVKTFGKGGVNRVHQLSNGGALYITYARWFTPNGRQIDKEGITPDIEVEMTPKDIESGRDPQLERAVEYLRGREGEGSKGEWERGDLSL